MSGVATRLLSSPGTLHDPISEEYHRYVDKPKKSPEPSADAPSEAYLRFERMTAALFRVDKRDVPKNEAKKRGRILRRESSLE